MSENILLKPDQLVVVKTGAPNAGGGSWFHPKLVVAFARWLHPRFAVWCDMQVEEILRGNRGVAAMPAPAVPEYYEPGKEYRAAMREDRKILISALVYSHLLDESDAYRAQLDDYRTRVIGLQSQQIALLEKLAKRGIKP